MEMTILFQEIKNIYIKFWASWCPTCLAGLEELDRLAGETNNFEVVTVVFSRNKWKKKILLNLRSGMIH